MGDNDEVDDGFDNERCFKIDFKPVEEFDNCCWRTGGEPVTGERCEFVPGVVGVADSGDGSMGESLILVGVVGVVIIANGGGIGLRLNFADGPRRSRILADDVLGEFVDESGNDEADGILEIGGLRRFVDVERFGNDGGGQFNVEMRLLLDEVLSVGVVGGGFRVSDGDMSDAGTGGGGGWSVVANDLKIAKINEFEKIEIEINFYIGLYFATAAAAIVVWAKAVWNEFTIELDDGSDKRCKCGNGGGGGGGSGGVNTDDILTGDGDVIEMGRFKFIVGTDVTGKWNGEVVEIVGVVLTGDIDGIGWAFNAAARAAWIHWASVADDVDAESVDTSSLTLFTVVLVFVVVFWFCCSISVAGDNDELEEDEEDDVVDFCCPWFISYICLSNNLIRSSSGIRVVDESSSVLLERFVSTNVSCFIVVVGVVIDDDDDGLFKPSDECFKCAFGLSTTRTFADVVEVLICSKANCGNGKRINSTWSLNKDG